MVGFDIKGLFQCKQFYDFPTGWPLLSKVVPSTSGDQQLEQERGKELPPSASSNPVCQLHRETKESIHFPAQHLPLALPGAQSPAALGSYTAMAPTSDL